MLFQPGLAVKVGMSDLNNHVQCTHEIKQMFDNFADKGTPFIIVCNTKFKYEKVKFRI